MEMRYFTNSIFLIIIIIIPSLATFATRCEGLWIRARYNALGEAHVTQGNIHGNAVIVSWHTLKYGSSMVVYGTSKHILDEIAWGNSTHNKSSFHKVFHEYIRSDFTHHCFISNLDFDTKYYYMVGIGYTNIVHRYWFKTPPRMGPYLGDHRTLSKVETVLYGEEYAENNKWECNRWGHFVETADLNPPQTLFFTPRRNCQFEQRDCKMQNSSNSDHSLLPIHKDSKQWSHFSPVSACCEIFIEAVRANREDCVCSLLWDPLLLDFPVDTNRLVSPFSSCGASDLASSWIYDTCGGTYLPSSSTAHVALSLSGSTSHLYTIEPSGLTPLLRTSLF